MKAIVTINNNQVPIKNPDKTFWPEDGFTKADIMQYYALVWPALAPHLHNRPVSLVRYPEGIDGNFFYQKDIADPPDWVMTIPIQSEERLINYAMINNLETLVWSVNLGCIEVHPWLSASVSLDSPTYLIFDLDPMPPASFAEAVKVALLVKLLLKELALQAFPKISGATGIHIYLPLQAGYSFLQTGNFVKKIGELIIATNPDLATNERKVANRSGKVYIDHLQNRRGKTIASVYSICPFSGAPVSMPVSWEELPDVHPAMFNVRTAPQRLQKVGDLFRPLFNLRQKLPESFIN